MLKCYGFIEHVCHSYLWRDIMNCGQWQIFHNPHRRLHLESLKALLVTTITRHQHQSHGLLHTKTTIAQKEKKNTIISNMNRFYAEFWEKIREKKNQLTYPDWKTRQHFTFGSCSILTVFISLSHCTNSGNGSIQPHVPGPQRTWNSTKS